MRWMRGGVTRHECAQESEQGLGKSLLSGDHGGEAGDDNRSLSRSRGRRCRMIRRLGAKVGYGSRRQSSGSAHREGVRGDALDLAMQLAPERRDSFQVWICISGPTFEEMLQLTSWNIPVQFHNLEHTIRHARNIRRERGYQTRFPMGPVAVSWESLVYGASGLRRVFECELRLLGDSPAESCTGVKNWRPSWILSWRPRSQWLVTPR